MIFVEKALSMMSKGYAAIIIQNSAGSGKATEYNKKILKHSTLLASIKMPIDLFLGKSSVQTNIYVFRVGEAHQKDDTVKFIDFSIKNIYKDDRKIIFIVEKNELFSQGSYATICYQPDTECRFVKHIGQ